MKRMGLLALTFVILSLSACSHIDSTQELDQKQIANLTRQMYHIKPEVPKQQKKAA